MGKLWGTEPRKHHDDPKKSLQPPPNSGKHIKSHVEYSTRRSRALVLQATPVRTQGPPSIGTCIGTRQLRGWPLWPGQNSGASQTELLVASHEEAHHRIRAVMPHLPTRQSAMTPTIRTVITAGAALCSMAVHQHGLHHQFARFY